MDIPVSKKITENSYTVEESVLIINFDNSDDPDSKKEDASSEANPTHGEENFENDSEEEPNKENDSEANKIADKPQFQQHRINAFASASKQCDTQEESYQKLFMTRQNTDDKKEMKESEKDEEKHTKGATSMESERKQDSSDSEDEIFHDSEDEDEDSDGLDRKMMEIDLACRLVDQMKEGVNMPRHHSVDFLTLEEIEEEILQIELACSLKEASTRGENTEPDLIRFHKFLTEHRQDITPVARDVQNLISTETESHDEDPDLTGINYGRHVSFHSVELVSGRVNPIPRHYYSEDSEKQKESKGNVKQDIRSRKEHRDLHRPKPVSATDHVMTHLRNIHEHDELRIDPLTTEGIQRPANQTDDSENSTNRLDVDDLEDRAQAAHNLFANEANRPEQQDNQTGNKIDSSSEE